MSKFFTTATGLHDMNCLHLTLKDNSMIRISHGAGTKNTSLPLLNL